MERVESGFRARMHNAEHHATLPLVMTVKGQTWHICRPNPTRTILIRINIKSHSTQGRGRSDYKAINIKNTMILVDCKFNFQPMLGHGCINENLDCIYTKNKIRPNIN